MHILILRTLELGLTHKTDFLVLLLHRVFFNGCSDLIYHIAAVWQQICVAHLAPAPGWTTGWYSASCNLHWFESEPSCGPGTHPSSHPKSVRPATNRGQEMKSQMLLNKTLLELEFEAVWTHQQNLAEPKNMIICNSWALVGFVEEQSNTAHNQQHTQVLSERVFLFQQRHAEDHHWNGTTDAPVRQTSSLTCQELSSLKLKGTLAEITCAALCVVKW